MKYICLVPSFNEEKTIGWLVKSLKDKGFDVTVIDDGSSDGTAKLAHDQGAEVIINEKNLGKGASLRKAFEILKGRVYDGVIIMDGDGQHLPSDVDQFVHCFHEKAPGIVVGNRMHSPKGMPLIRQVTNAFMSFIISRMCRQRVPDTQCGFRLISMKALRAIALNTDRYEIESEMLLEVSRAGYGIESVPIASVYDGQFSAIHPWRDTVRFFKFILHRDDHDARGTKKDDKL
ncbi:MAG: glycosyltransferase family 2 protein [Candidatus Omnitrophica bacterium]|nr:glycosyltransferase family 2 protein [Candidatus Omnitrophota bacterium]MDD5574470.1 glycosyltransferase family 2 protein [Candidatus Omnitrophota bacterium]